MNRREAIGAAIGAVAGACVPVSPASTAGEPKGGFIHTIRVRQDTNDAGLWLVQFEWTDGCRAEVSTRKRPNTADMSRLLRTRPNVRTLASLLMR